MSSGTLYNRTSKTIQEVQSSTCTWKLIACGAAAAVSDTSSSTPETDQEHVTMQALVASLHKRGVANAVLLSNSSSCCVKDHFTNDAAKKRYTVHELGCCALFCGSADATKAAAVVVAPVQSEQPAAAHCIELLPPLSALDSAVFTKVAVTAAGALVYTVHTECGTTVSSVELLPEQ
jgi:hypothetical protein